jgi:predicted nucleic acid-binding protein
MIRVVLDTNILISALLNPQGLPAQIFLMTILDPGTRLCVTGDIFADMRCVTDETMTETQ